ncbi:MAG: hypothetical protein ACPIOQ_14115, partial [Promethearchaeia archaeon]
LCRRGGARADGERATEVATAGGRYARTEEGWQESAAATVGPWPSAPPRPVMSVGFVSALPDDQRIPGGSHTTGPLRPATAGGSAARAKPVDWVVCDVTAASAASRS